MTNPITEPAPSAADHSSAAPSNEGAGSATVGAAQHPDKLFTEADLLAIMEPCVNCGVALMQLRRKRYLEEQ